MRHRSPKKEAEYRLRRPLVEALIEEHPFCQACPTWAGYDGLSTFRQRRSVDPHELVRRSRGGSILDPQNILMICRSCHTRIGNHPDTAERLGLELPSWATEEHYVEAVEARESWARGEEFDPSYWVKP
jgi:hypothetical protein